MSDWKPYDVLAKRGSASTRYYVNSTGSKAAVKMVMQQLKDIGSTWSTAAFTAEEMK